MDQLLLEEAIVPLLGRRVRAGSRPASTRPTVPGPSLVPADRRIAEVAGLSVADAVGCVHGIDPGSVADRGRPSPAVARGALDASVGPRRETMRALRRRAGADHRRVVRQGGHGDRRSWTGCARRRRARHRWMEWSRRTPTPCAVFLLRVRRPRCATAAGSGWSRCSCSARGAGCRARAGGARSGGGRCRVRSRHRAGRCSTGRRCHPARPVLERGRPGSGEEWSAVAAPWWGCPSGHAVGRTQGVLEELGPCTRPTHAAVARPGPVGAPIGELRRGRSRGAPTNGSRPDRADPDACGRTAAEVWPAAVCRTRRRCWNWLCG